MSHSFRRLGRLDLHWLESERCRYLDGALAPNTRRTYGTGVRQYLRFCQEIGTAPFPLVERVLEYFVVVLARRVGYRTIRVYLCGVQQESLVHGGSSLLREMHSLHYLVRGIKRDQGRAHFRAPRVPITGPMLRSILAGIGDNFSGRDAAMLSAAVTLAFFGMLRVSEYTAPGSRVWVPGSTLTVDDVFLDWDRRVMLVRVVGSKTDPFRVGVTIRVCATGSHLCPFRAMARYLELRGVAGGPLFVFGDGSLLTRVCVAGVLRRFAPVPTVNTHSLRQGGATMLAQLGVAPYVIQCLGRWASDAYLRYIQFSDEFIGQVMGGMARACHR